MQDIFDLPDNSEYNKIFYTTGGGSVTTGNWQIWSKPKNIRFIKIWMIGGGGGGGGGAKNINGVSRGGGGGGGSSAIAQGIFSANVIPDILYVYVGRGGPGGAAQTNGTVGELSYVGVNPNTSSINLVLQSGAGAAGAGGGTSNSGNGAAGTAGSVFAQANAQLSYLGVINLIAGAAGVQGGNGLTPTAGSSIVISLPVTGGAGGGSSTSASVDLLGGSIIGMGFIPTISPGVTGSYVDGMDGFTSIPSQRSSNYLPLFFTGGAGGSGNGLGAGGNGGDASYGCGGGGGAAGNSSFGGCLGGKGGDGLVIITAW